MQTDVLLVGGGVASARCARALRRNGFGGSILLAGDESLPPYNRPPLSKELLRDGHPPELLAAEPAGWYEKHHVDLLTGVAVTRLEPDQGRATLADRRTVGFRHCVVATGAAPRALLVPGGERALLLRTLDDAQRLRQAALAAPPGVPVVVVGGGLIGVEIASGLAALGVAPTVVELGDALWAGSLGELLSSWALDRLRGLGVTVRLGAAVSALDEDGAWAADERLRGSFVVAGIGVQPRDELAAAAGLDAGGGVVVDADQRTSHPAVWAAGDVARTAGRAGEHWHAARESGERAALSILGLTGAPRRAPWIFTEVAGVGVDVFGDAAVDDDEHWIIDGRGIARTRGHRLVQLIVIGSAIPAKAARELVERGVSDSELRGAVESPLV
ncbi:MAG: FAD-dependent oxidoreductase [Chloroflexi bacterium]|nr:FAD-dependent oxidoreductase [Chloroflexota bacterium]